MKFINLFYISSLNNIAIHMFLIAFLAFICSNFSPYGFYGPKIIFFYLFTNSLNDYSLFTMVVMLLFTELCFFTASFSLILMPFSDFLLSGINLRNSFG